MNLIKILVLTATISVYITFFIAQMRMDNSHINSLIGEMTLEEKVSLVHGSKGSDPSEIPCAGYVSGIQRLSIPPLTMQNVPSGAGASFGHQRDKRSASALHVSANQASTLEQKASQGVREGDYPGGQTLRIQTKEGKTLTASHTPDEIWKPGACSMISSTSS